MKQWIVAHIDALIPLVVGLFVCVKAFFLPKSDSSSLDSAKKRQILPVVGGLLILIGISRFFTDSMAAAEGQPRSMIGYESSSEKFSGYSQKVDPAEFQKPVTATTDDGMASAEFPVKPVRREAIDRGQGVEVKRVTHEAEFAQGALSLRLSFSGYPPGGEGLPDEVRMGELKRGFLNGGYQVIEESATPGGIHKLVVENSGEGTRLSMRFKFTPRGVYRVLVTSQGGRHDDKRIGPFLESFAVK